MEKEKSKYGEAVRRVKELISEGQDRMRSDHSAISERLSLGLDFEHYNQKDSSQSPSRILPRDPGMFDVVRYKSALTLKRAPISIRCRQVEDDAGDFGADAVDEVKDALEDWLGDPRNRFKDTRRRYVMGAYAAGAWAARLDYDPERRTAVVRPLDPRNVILPDGIFDPHDPDCEYVIILDRVPTERVKRMKKWKHVREAKPDAGFDFPGASDNGTLKPGQVSLESSGPDGDDDPSARTTIAYCYYRNSGKRKAVKAEGQVAPGEERLLCGSCYWTSPPQREMMEPLPMAAPCPQCGELAELTDAPLEHEPAYPDGRLVICAPLNDHLAQPFYDGEWPVQWPTFPILWWTPYVYPHRLLPQSDVSIHKTGVLASNAIIRLWYEQALISKPRMKVPRVGLMNAKGQPYTFAPSDGDVIFDERVGPQDPIQVIQGAPMNTSLTALYDRLQGRFRENQGTSQISLDPQQSKDIAVGTVKTLTETGNVPLDDHVASLYDAESPFMACLAETLRMAYVPARKIRTLGPDGRETFKAVSGATMPRVLVEVSAGPTLDSMEMQKMEAYRALIQMPPQYRKGMARFAKIDPEVIRQIEQDETEFMDAQQQANPMGNGMPPGMVPEGQMGVPSA